MPLAPGILHPARLHPERLQQAQEMLQRTNATREDFAVKTRDDVELSGWKIRPTKPNGDWVLLFHGVSDNRTGVLSAAELLLRYGFSVVMMDSRAHGLSGGEMATYGWKELWIVRGALHASALGQDPIEYEKRVVAFFENTAARH